MKLGILSDFDSKCMTSGAYSPTLNRKIGAIYVGD